MTASQVAAIPGDGIGTEVVSAGIEVLHALAKRHRGFEFHVDHFDWGGEYYKKHGRMMPENGRSLIRNRSEEHTSELQSPDHLVCRLLLEKKKKNQVTSKKPPPQVRQQW